MRNGEPGTICSWKICPAEKFPCGMLSFALAEFFSNKSKKVWNADIELVKNGPVVAPFSSLELFFNANDYLKRNIMMSFLAWVATDWKLWRLCRTCDVAPIWYPLLLFLSFDNVDFFSIEKIVFWYQLSFEQNTSSFALTGGFLVCGFSCADCEHLSRPVHGQNFSIHELLSYPQKGLILR